MHNTFFIADLHLGHNHILQFQPNRPVSTLEEHTEWLIDMWNSVVTKKDTVWMLGDVAFNTHSLKHLKRMRGNKILVLGNHDKSAKHQCEYFSSIFGIVKRYGFWLSHCPIHPQELRGFKNIHGHVHTETVPDDRYINVSVDVLNGIPISLDEIKEKQDEIY